MTTTRTRQESDRQSDRRLVRACLRGDSSAWEKLIGRYRRLIYSIPRSLGVAPADADEIFQQVAIKLLEHLGGLRDGASLPAWLAVTTRRECYAVFERGRRWVSQGDDPPEIESDAESADGVLHRVACEHTLALAMERMEPLCHKLLQALYFEEPAPSYQELSTRLKRPLGSLGPTRSRCLAKLRSHYKKLGGADY